MKISLMKHIKYGDFCLRISWFMIWLIWTQEKEKIKKLNIKK